MMGSAREPSRARAGGRGFTLVELLTGVAIISLLLAILLPSLRNARTLAKRTACQTNLREVARGWDIYLTDHDGFFYQGGNANVDFGGWRGVKGWSRRPLNRCLGLPKAVGVEGARVFCCPADNGGVPGTSLPAYFFLGNSYQTNVLLIGQNRIRLRAPGWPAACTEPEPPPDGPSLEERINERLRTLKRGHVHDASRLLLVGDYGWVNQWSAPVRKRTEWHARCCHHNLAFLDGHVAFVRIEKGVFVSGAGGYRVLPFADLDVLAFRCQEKNPCEHCDRP